jgi:AmmeMemoRadiSam system protein A
VTEPSPYLPAVSEEDRAALLALARATIEARLGVASATEPEYRAVLDRPGGAFVTVFVNRQLRGCVGLPETAEPLGAVVRYAARSAAFRDPRFPPVGLADLPGLSIEISVLTPFEPVFDPSAIDVGRHGLVVEQGTQRGLLLPQVATEHGWTREQFLEHTCIKAGLNPHAWRHGASLYRFEAVVFAEHELSRHS